MHQHAAKCCASCGHPTHLVHQGRTERVKAPRNIRRQRLQLRPEAPPRWAGFAGLARTVTERLIQTPTNDITPSDTQHWTQPLADVQHVLSGKCSAGREYDNVKKEMMAAVAQIERRVVQGAGIYSSLHMKIHTAHTYLTGKTTEDGDKKGWEALRS